MLFVPRSWKDEQIPFFFFDYQAQNYRLFYFSYSRDAFDMLLQEVYRTHDISESFKRPSKP